MIPLDHPSYRIADSPPELFDALEESWAPPENWRVVPSFNDYIVSDKGRIRHRRPNASDLKGSVDKDGYRSVNIGGCTIRLHVIVAEAFHGPRPEGFQCAHLDGNPKNNRASNLAWVTPKENNDHKRLHGTHQAGEKHPRAKLTAEQVASIRTADGVSTRALAVQYGVNQSHIVRIRKGDRWSSTTTPCIAIASAAIAENFIPAALGLMAGMMLTVGLASIVSRFL